MLSLLFLLITVCFLALLISMVLWPMSETYKKAFENALRVSVLIHAIYIFWPDIRDLLNIEGVSF